MKCRPPLKVPAGRSASAAVVLPSGTAVQQAPPLLGGETGVSVSETCPGPSGLLATMCPVTMSPCRCEWRPACCRPGPRHGARAPASACRQSTAASCPCCCREEGGLRRGRRSRLGTATARSWCPCLACDCPREECLRARWGRPVGCNALGKAPREKRSVPLAARFPSVAEALGMMGAAGWQATDVRQTVFGGEGPEEVLRDTARGFSGHRRPKRSSRSTVRCSPLTPRA